MEFITHLIARVSEEIKTFFATPIDIRREYLERRVTVHYGTFVEPWDIPIPFLPEAWADAILLKLVLLATDKIYVAIAGRFSDGHPMPPWPEMEGPAAEPSTVNAV